MAQYIYTTNQLSKLIPPNKHILRDISLSFFPGAKIGILGLNGSGKSTLLKIIAGVDKEFDGEARPQADIKIGFLPQEPELDTNKNVKENVEEGITELIKLIDQFNLISEEFAKPMSDDAMSSLLEKQGKLQDSIDAVGGWEIERKLERASDALRLPPWETKVDQLSGGEKRRIALCRLLLSEPDILLLDEPTNHLDFATMEAFERALNEFKGTLVAVSHDATFIEKMEAEVWQIGD